MKFNCLFLYITLCIGWLAINVFSEEAIVQIGEKTYSKTEIVNLLKTEDSDPMIVVNGLKKDEAYKILAEKRKGDVKDPQSSLYRQLFDADYKNEKMKVDLKDVPPGAKIMEARRLNIFNQWVETMADEMVPVIFLDQNEFWSLMKNTKSYAIRKEAGYEPKFEDWEYTRTELSVDPAMIVAIKNKIAYVTGKELTDYIIGNFNGIRNFAKRDKSVNEVRNIIIPYVVAGKLMAESVLNKSIKFDAVDLDLAEDRFIQRNMMGMDLSLKDQNFKDNPRVRDAIYNNYKEKSQKKINDFKKILKGEIQATTSNSITDLCIMEAAENTAHRQIAAAISDDEIYNWMKTTKFPGSVSDAKTAFASEKYQADIEKKITDQGIVMNLFPIK